jgi:SsrA-binding protein
MSKQKAKSEPTPTARDANARKIVSVNRRAWHEFEMFDTYEAGLVLVGTEVKSLRAGRVNIQDAFCKFEQGEAWILGMHVTPYEQGNRWNVEPARPRKLLLHGWQIEELRAKSEQKGLTIVPLRLFFQRGYAKLEIGLARGKKLYDKRESIAERDRERESRREASNRPPA